MIARARFTAALDGDDMIVVIDQDGGKSVTNDVEKVIETIADYCTIGSRQMIYRDTEGMWDGVVIARGKFFGFVPMRVKDREIALAMARDLIRQQCWGNKAL